MYKRIFVAYDASSCAIKALDDAILLAKSQAATRCIAHVDDGAISHGGLDIHGYVDGLDKVTGQIDKTVAEAWRPMDLRIFFEENWATVGPKVAGRIHVGVGDDDNYFLNNAVELLDASLAERTDPVTDAEFWYGPNGGHSWRPYTTPELLTIMYRAMRP